MCLNVFLKPSSGILYAMKSMPFLNREVRNKWVIGVSGGPDSMALLDMCRQAKLDSFVVHVNYHKRESAKRDQSFVESYCLSHQIPYRIVDALGFKKGNFQAWARKIRYEAMVEEVNEQNALGILVAHHLDDDCETFVMQKKRQSKVSYYGLKEESLYHQVRLVRPLLSLSKNDLVRYCDQHKIPYGLDESNQDLHYARNAVRQHLDSLDESGKRSLMDEKDQLNALKESQMSRYQTEIHSNVLVYEVYQKINLEWPDFLLEWLRHHQVKGQLSRALVTELKRQLEHSARFHYEFGQLRLSKQYGNLSLSQMVEPYLYVLEKDQHLKTPFFEILDQGEAFEVSDNDFPLTIRNAGTKDVIKTETGVKSLNRWFIKNKIPRLKRELWPVVLNHEGQVIFIPKCSFVQRYQPNKITLYMIK